MSPLINKTQNLQIVESVKTANSLLLRMKGLIGEKSWPSTSALWIPHCNSIHTFFMPFAIDVIFVDNQLRVKKILRSLKPGKIVWPVWGARSVFELRSGTLANQIKEGDQLYVGH